MLGFACLMGIGIFFYCSFIYPYAVKVERRQNRERGDRWRRWMGREDDVEDIPWAGLKQTKAKPAVPPLDPDIDSSPVVPVTDERPFKPPMRP